MSRELSSSPQWPEVSPHVHYCDLIGMQSFDAFKFIILADKVAEAFEALEAFVRLTKNLRMAGIDVDGANPSSSADSHLCRPPGRDQLGRRPRSWAYSIRPSIHFARNPVE